MKVQTKITLLLVVVVATFLGGLYAFRAYDHVRFRNIAEQRFEERNRSFEDFLKYYGQPLDTVVRDYTLWDQMVNAIAARDQPWFDENISDSTLDGFHANAVWVCAADGSSVYERNNLNTGELIPLPVSATCADAVVRARAVRAFLRANAARA